MDIYLFPTCLSDMLNRKILTSAKMLLESMGIRVHVSKLATCCSQPAYNSGYVKAARLVAEQQLKAFPEEEWPIIVTSASCSSMIKHHYAKLFKHKDLSKLSRRVHEFSAFYLDNILHMKDYGDELAVICHPSCHAIRELRQADKAIEILNRLERVQLVSIDNENECCGFGGTFAVKHANISTSLADRKIDEIMQAVEKYSVKKLLGIDYSCLLHLQGRIQKRGISLEVQHLACFLEERLFKPKID